MIYIITGKTGHGKTAYMVKWMRSELKAGRRIFTNIRIFPEKMGLKKPVKEGNIWDKQARDNPEVQVLYWQNFSDWQWFEDGVAFIDEGLVYFNARDWGNLPKSMQLRFTQHRKHRTDLVFNVQHYTFIDKTLRMLAEEFMNVELKIGSANFKKTLMPRISKVTSLDLITLNRLEAMNIDPFNTTEEEEEKFNLPRIGSSWFWIRPKIFNWYDTSEEVGESRPEPLIHLERSCPSCDKVAVSHS